MLVRAMKRYRNDPAAFVREILHAEPQAWQAEALSALAGHKRLAVRSGHG
ncbi:MAG: hypothetical protein IKO05_12190 [Selenomonadaceae bacterium]|nr:hypothetical protein [Selenomonadaceae bacterium]